MSTINTMWGPVEGPANLDRFNHLENEFLRRRAFAQAPATRPDRLFQRSSVLGSRDLRGRDLPYKLTTTLREDNFVAFAMGAIVDEIRDAWSSGKDRDYDPKVFVGAMKKRAAMSESEEKFLLGSGNERQMMTRVQLIQEERDRMEVQARMGFGERLFYGLVGGVTDPVSWVPLIGQGARGQQAYRMYRKADSLLKSGRGTFATRLTLMREQARRGFWRTATESMMYESVFQGMRQAQSINDRSGEFLPTVAFTGAFGGLIGGGIRGLGSTRSTGRAVYSARTRISGGQVDGLRRAAAQTRPEITAGGLGWKKTGAEKPVGVRLARVKGPGARLRLQARENAARFQKNAEYEVQQMILREGAATDEAQALAMARELLSSQEGYVNPIRDPKKITPIGEGTGALAALTREADVEAGGAFREIDIEAGRDFDVEAAARKRANKGPDPTGKRSSRAVLPKGFGLAKLRSWFRKNVNLPDALEDLQLAATLRGFDGGLIVSADDIRHLTDGKSKSEVERIHERLGRGGLRIADDVQETQDILRQSGMTVDELIDLAWNANKKPSLASRADAVAKGEGNLDPKTRLVGLLVSLHDARKKSGKKLVGMQAYRAKDVPTGSTLSIQGVKFKVVEEDGVRFLVGGKRTRNAGTSLEATDFDYKIELDENLVSVLVVDEGSISTGAARKITGQISALSRKINAERKKPAGERNLNDLAMWERQRDNLRAGRSIDDAGPDAKVAEEILDTMNRPRQAEEGRSSKTMEETDAEASIREKVEASSSTTKQGMDVLMKLQAAAENGMARFSNFLKTAPGRGITNVLIAATKGRPVRMMVSVAGLDDVQVEFSVAYNTSNKYPNRPAFYSPKTKTAWVDRASATKMWNENSRRSPVLAKSPESVSSMDDVQFLLPQDIADTLEEFIDHLLMHEIVHATHHQGFKNTPPNMPGIAKSKQDYNILLEALVNEQVGQWKRTMQDPGPADDPSTMFYTTVGPEPAPNSVPHRGTGNPKSSVMINLEANGWKKSAAQAFTRVLEFVSPVWRGALNPSSTLREVQRYLINDPIYRWDTGPRDGSALTNRFAHHEAPRRRIQRIALNEWKAVSKEIGPDAKISKEQFGARAQEAKVNGGKDKVVDAYSEAVERFAKLSKEADDHTLSRGVMVGLEDNMYMPKGESYYHRMWVRKKVDSEDFVTMVSKYTDEETARAIQEGIITTASRPRNAISRLIKDRGVMKSRGEVMKLVSYEDLKPFIETDLFKTQAHLGKAVGGEIEFRLAMVNFAKANKIKNFFIDNEPVLDSQGRPLKDADGVERTRNGLNWKALEDYLEGKWKALENQGRFIEDINEVSAAYHKSFIEFDKFAKEYPEQAKQYKEGVDQIIDTGLSHKQLEKHAAFARRWFNDMAQIVQNTKDIPDNPDSWMQARLPALIKNYSHMIMGGGLAAANLADFHRSVAEFGFKRVFNQEWTLWMRDLEAWSARVKVTEAMGLAAEDLRADIQRNLRNALETGDAETGFERGIAAGASFMSKVNGMAYVVNGHQKAFSSGIQSYLLDMIPKYVAGEADARTVAKLQRLGLDMAAAKRINNAFENGARKKSAKGTSYVDVWDGEGWHDFVKAVNRGVEINQSSPARAEMWDFQTQGMSSLLFMYRSWATASTNRVAASVLAGEKGHIMAGLAASVGLGSIVVVLKSLLSGTHGSVFEDPDQFLRKSIDSGGYFGIIGEMHNIISKATNGALDVLPGDGGNRYYNSATALSAIAGPIWAYPNFVSKTGTNLVTLDLDRYDIERTKNMFPFAQLHAVDAMYNHAAILMEDDEYGP